MCAASVFCGGLLLVFSLCAATGSSARDCDSNLCRWEHAFLLARRSQLRVQQQHSASWPWHSTQQGHDNPCACSNRQQHQVWQPLPRHQAVLFLICYKNSVFSEIAIKALVTAESQVKIWQWAQAEREEFRTMLFFSNFDDKYVKPKDSWKTEKPGALITPKVKIPVCFRINLHCWTRSVHKYSPLNVLKYLSSALQESV